MTDNTILAEARADFDSHTVRDGIIRDPGRFEGETILTVYCDHLEANGCGGDPISDPDSDDFASVFDVDDELRVELASVGYDFESDTVAVLYTVSSTGFVGAEELTAAQRDGIVADRMNRGE